MNLLREKLAKYDAPQRAKAAGIYPYFREIQSDQDTEVIIGGKKVLMFGSNSYLGLTNHPKVKEAAMEAIRKYGTGCAGSRFLNGTLDIHVQLEKRLAKFVGKEDAISFSTGFQVNEGVISCITGREDYLIWDELNHAFIIEGIRLSFSNKLKYKHNDMESLEKQLRRCEPDKVKLIVTDGVFSIERDMAHVTEIVRLAKQYNASIMVDEAHGIGVLGNHGRGTCDHFERIRAPAPLSSAAGRGRLSASRYGWHWRRTTQAAPSRRWPATGANDSEAYRAERRPFRNNPHATRPPAPRTR